MKGLIGARSWIYGLLAAALLLQGGSPLLGLIAPVGRSESRPRHSASRWRLQAAAKRAAMPQAPANDPVLTTVADVPLPGPAVRFDYQSFNPATGMLYIAHMNANHLIVFNARTRKVMANLPGINGVHGVLVVPQLHRVYASATGEHAVLAVDTQTLQITGRAGPIAYPDGIGYAPAENRVFVSDEHGGVDAVIDARINRLIGKIRLGGGAGNTVYDPGSERILVAVHGINELVAIDPKALKIVARYPLPGVDNPHGIALDLADRLAFVAGENNHSLAVFDLQTRELLSVHPVGDDPDVLAFDPGLRRLYVAAESGTVCVFQETGHNLRLLGKLDMPHAHTVAVDPDTHLLYFPLQNWGGHAVLRIMRPSGQR